MYVMTYDATSARSPDTSAFEVILVKGQPPIMIVSQKVVGTTITAKCDGMGPGGDTPSPTVMKTMGLSTAVATTVTRTSATPLTG